MCVLYLGYNCLGIYDKLLFRCIDITTLTLLVVDRH